MAANTDKSLQKQLIYSIFVRNHTREGTFKAIIPDLPRIRELGTDIIWLMPIHPIGKAARKGSLGSPYAIADYRKINPEYGTLEDFRELVDAIHQQGMKCLIDVVYNHTSPDSLLYQTHPEYFYHKPDGRPGNHVGEWTDIIDLDYQVKELWDYQIETLIYWAQFVDGFRCDVASFVPLEFWKAARQAVEQVHPHTIWLAETVHRSFGQLARRSGLYSGRDTEMYEAFDLEYDYDTREAFDGLLTGRTALNHYLDLLSFQESVYPENYNKLRFLENHDTERIASLIKDETVMENYLALLFFLKGTAMIYGGQEYGNSVRPDLFNKDSIDWTVEHDFTPLIRRLVQIRQEQFGCCDYFEAQADEKNQIAVCYRYNPSNQLVGIFSLQGKTAAAEVQLPDGIYTDLISGSDLEIRDHQLTSIGRPVIIKQHIKK